MIRKSSGLLLALMLLLPLGCRQNEQVTTQTSEVVVLDDEPSVPTDPFDQDFEVDGERALRAGRDVERPRLASRGPRVKFSSSNRSICFPAASIIVVVDKTGTVRQTEIVSVAPAVEYFGDEKKQLSADESLALIKEMEIAIYNWQYEPAIKDGEPVPFVIDGGWRMNCR